MSDMVNHPPHYTQRGVECIDIIEEFCDACYSFWPWKRVHPRVVVCLCHVVRYMWRHDDKNGYQDVEKARWYFERMKHGRRRWIKAYEKLLAILDRHNLATVEGDIMALVFPLEW